MTASDISQAAAEAGLMIMGGTALPTGGTRILLGAASDFWRYLQTSPEYQDGAADPIDRYSTRIVTALATRFGAQADFPFGGPPYAPFIAWAEASGHAWPSPTGMLVHDQAGLMISYRGALTVPQTIALPPIGQSPCHNCVDQPCTTACPVGALSGDRAYDVPACHRFLDTEPGQDCLSQGCRTRRACPVSQSFGRNPAQSEHHMRAFHPS